MKKRKKKRREDIKTHRKKTRRRKRRKKKMSLKVESIPQLTSQTVSKFRRALGFDAFSQWALCFSQRIRHCYKSEAFASPSDCSKDKFEILIAPVPARNGTARGVGVGLGGGDEGGEEEGEEKQTDRLEGNSMTMNLGMVSHINREDPTLLTKMEQTVISHQQVIRSL